MLHGSAQCILKKTQGVSLNKINKINSIFTLDQLCKAATKIALIYVHPCFKRILMKHTEKKSSLTSVINKHIFFCLNFLFLVLDKKIFLTAPLFWFLALQRGKAKIDVIYYTFICSDSKQHIKVFVNAMQFSLAKKEC